MTFAHTRCRGARRFALALLMAASAGVAGCGGGSGTSDHPAPTSGPGTAAGSSSDGGGDTLIRLAWAPNTDAVTGYIVYYGAGVDDTAAVASNLSVGGGFDARAPAVSYYAQRDLRLSPGSRVCFRLRAYNGSNVLSDWSQPACGTI